MFSRLRPLATYGNVTATLALFLALGGSAYAVLRVDSQNIVDNSVRSSDLRNNSIREKDVRDRALRGRDIASDSLAGTVIRERGLGTVPSASSAERLGGFTAQDLKLRCPSDTVVKAGVCIESTARAPADFLAATNQCDNVGRGLPTMPQLDRFARSSGPLSAQGEWTSSVFLYEPNGATTFDQLAALLVSSFGDIDQARVLAPSQHAFRCVALPSN